MTTEKIFADSAEFVEEYKKEFLRSVAESFKTCDKQEKYAALARLICGRAAALAAESTEKYRAEGAKQVYYFSMEFLIGRLLKNYLLNLDIEDIVREGLNSLGEDLDELYLCEADPGLGNGGLGRLAACFMDSLACLGLAGYGMGIRYRYGLFRQQLSTAGQTEAADDWLAGGYPLELCRREDAVEVHFGGRVERQCTDGRWYFRHTGYQAVRAVPYDVPMAGDSGRVNMLRLWSAEPVHEQLDLAAFNRGDYSAAFKSRNDVEAITCILYPDDSQASGQELRLKQEYFFVSAGIKAILKNYKEQFGGGAWAELPRRVAIHTNDTHPALAVPELMRILLDEEGLEWDEAWRITTATISYTNHTVMPEALEKWSIELLRRLLPRVYMIIEEIDRRFREAFPHNEGWQERLMSTAILWDGQVRMANLSVIGSHSVNGVAALHTEILKHDVLKDFYALCPEKFNNKTNGVSHRRFLLAANPGLSRLIDEAIGSGWRRDAARLAELLRYEQDDKFLADLAAVKRQNKLRLAEYAGKTCGILPDPDAVFDVQVKRIHAYKRQLLNAFKIMHLYNLIHAGAGGDIPPHCFIFAGKAAQGYAFAKEVIRLIMSVAELVNGDPLCRGKIQVVFLENFNVSLGELIYPAADISEQISTAGKEASGTGNMKFMFNGAVTLGTLDGANIEILEQVGRDNMKIFGLTAEQVMEYYLSGGYLAFDECKRDARLQLLCDQLINGHFKEQGGDFWGIYDTLLRNNDEYFVLKDFDAYFTAWRQLGEQYREQPVWRRMSLRNIAHAGYFSSDRTIKEYAAEIWKQRGQ